MNIDILWHSLIIAVPLVLSNSFHMLVVKYGIFEKFNIPISTRLFGQNKTYRGFLFLTIVNALIFLVFIQLIAIPSAMPVWYGALLGFLYLFFELPNSFFKRLLNISPGGTHHKFKYFFWWLDKSDSTLGLSLVHNVLGFVAFSEALWMYALLLFIHITTSVILVNSGIKKSF